MYDFIHNLIDHNIIMQDQTVSNIRNLDLIFTSFWSILTLFTFLLHSWIYVTLTEIVLLTVFLST